MIGFGLHFFMKVKLSIDCFNTKFSLCEYRAILQKIIKITQHYFEIKCSLVGPSAGLSCTQCFVCFFRFAEWNKIACIPQNAGSTSRRRVELRDGSGISPFFWRGRNGLPDHADRLWIAPNKAKIK